MQSNFALQFLDNIHVIRGGALQNMELALLRGEIQCIAETTPEGFKTVLELDSSLVALDRSLFSLLDSEELCL